MGRPRSEPYTLGKISFEAHPTKAGYRRARGGYLDRNGRRVNVTAAGATDNKAKRALQVKVEAARTQHKGGDSSMSESTRLPAAAAVWLDYASRLPSVKESTHKEYAGYVRRHIDRGPLAHLSLVEVNNIGRVEDWLAEIADANGPVAAKQARKVLKLILDMAERRGAIPASVMARTKAPNAKAGSPGDRKCKDPDCDYDCGKRHLDTNRAFTKEEATRVVALADESTADVGDLAAFLFATGARVHEALECVAWSDLDLSSGVVRIAGTKTDAANREVELPKQMVERLTARAERLGEQRGQVFGITRYASKLGEPRPVRGVSKSLREVFRKADVRWAGTHTFRRTVATWLDGDGAPLAEIASQLGHADPSVTAGYLGRKSLPTRAASVMVLDKPTSKGHLRAVSCE